MANFVELITRLSALVPMLSTWEMCALNLVQKQPPSSVFFLCNSASQCPGNNFYKALRSPSQTIFGLEMNALPTFRDSDLVFILVDHFVWNNETVQKYRLGGKNGFKIVVIKNGEENFDFQSMETLFRAMWISGVVNCAVVLINDSISQVFTYFPFRNGERCEDTTPVLIGDCGVDADRVFGLKVENLNKCPIRLSMDDDWPWLKRLPFTGILSGLILEIARKMNFSMVTVAPLAGRNGGVCGPEEFTGVKGDVYTGRAHLAVGSFSRRECSTLEYLSFPYTQCYTWCSPIFTGSDYIFSFLIGQFQPRVWGALILSVILVVFCILCFSSLMREVVSSSDIMNVAFLVFAQPPMLQFNSSAVRVVFGFWLVGCLVLRTAYEAELKSQYSVPLGSRVIRTAEELAEMKIPTCATIGSRQVLKNIDDLTIKKIYDKTGICNGSMFENIESAAKKKDRVVFTSDLRCSVTSSEISVKQSLLYPYTGGCIQTLQVTTIITLPGSPFKKFLENTQHRAFDSGLVNKWLDIRPIQGEVGQFRAYAMEQLFPVLFVFGVGCLAGSISFCVETVFFKWSKTRE